MVNELKFYQCKLCGKIIELLTEPHPDTICCAKPMERLVANTTDAAKEKHVPAVTRDGNKIHVEVGTTLHPMTDEHSIEWVILQTNKAVYRAQLTPSNKPVADFTINEGEEPAYVYAYCNLHGLWKTVL